MKIKVLIALLITAQVISIGVMTTANKELNDNKAVIDDYSEKVLELESNIDNLKEDISIIKDENSQLKIENEKSKSINNDLEETIRKMKEEVIYDDTNLRQLSNATEFHLMKSFKGTSFEGMGLEKSFLLAESQYNVNVYMLIGLVANESSWLSHSEAILNNNFTGYMAYNRGGDRKYFDSFEDNILETARLISEDYLDENGKYNGKTGKNDIYGVNVRYCLNDDGTTDYNWSKIINSIAYNLMNKANFGIEGVY